MSQTKAIVETIEIPVDQIKPSPYQPRLTFNLEDIRGSIQRDGILIPLTVRKKDGYYELIDGERRVRLAKELGYKTTPCTVIDVDDETARRMVWKVNTLRQEYTPKEKAYYFRELQEEYRMSLRGIARECDYGEQQVVAHLNVLKLPEKYQNLVWNGPLTVSHIQELRPYFNSGVSNEALIGKLELILERKLTVPELRKTIKPELEELEEKRVEAAKKAAQKVTPKVKEPETPEELEEAAQALRERAKELKTPEQILQEKREKARNVLLGGKGNALSKVDKAKGLGIETSEFEERIGGIKAKITDNPDEALKEAKKLKSDIGKAIKDFEEKQKEEEMRRKLEEEAKRKAEEELLKDKDFLKKAAELAPPIIERPMREEALFGFAPSPEQIEAIREQLKEGEERLKAIMDRPEVKERGKLFENWVAHDALLGVLGSAHCPICGANWENLRWQCHSLNIKDAYDLLTDKYQKAVKRGGR